MAILHDAPRLDSLPVFKLTDGVLAGFLYILCFNPKEAKRQSKHRRDVVALLEGELESHPNSDASAQWPIELLASQRYKRHLRVTKSGQIRINRDAIRQATKWVLETADDKEVSGLKASSLMKR